MERADFHLKASKSLAIFFVLLWLTTMWILVILSWPLLLKVLLSLLLTAYTIFSLKYHVLRTHPNAVRRFWVETPRGWGFETGARKIFLTSLLSENYIHPWLIVLRFKTLQGKVKNVTIPFDALSVEEFRVLSTHLRFTNFKVNAS